MKIFKGLSIILILILFGCSKENNDIVGTLKPEKNNYIYYNMSLHKKQESVISLFNLQNNDEHNYKVDKLLSYKTLMYNQYDDTILFTNEQDCTILELQRNGSQNFYNPCRLAKTSKIGRIKDLQITKDTIVIAINPVGIFNNEPNKTDLLVFDNNFNFKKKTTIHKRIEKLAVIENKVYYTIDTLDTDDKEDYNIYEYDFKKNINQTYYSSKEGLYNIFVNNNRINFVSHDNKIKDTSNNVLYSTDKTIYLYSTIYTNKIQYALGKIEDEEVYFEITKNKITPVFLNKRCLSNTSYINNDGVYCQINNKELIFNNFNTDSIIRINNKHDNKELNYINGYAFYKDK